MTRAANERMQTEGKKERSEDNRTGVRAEERVVKEDSRTARGCGESAFCGLRPHEASTGTSDDTLVPKWLSGDGHRESIGCWGQSLYSWPRAVTYSVCHCVL